MNGILCAFLGTLLTFSATAFGSAGIFFLKNEISSRLQSGFLGFAGGVMTAASIWSLLLPGMKYAEENGQIVWLSIAGGFFLGTSVLLIADTFIKKHYLAHEKKCFSSIDKGTLMLITAITVHNIPEGMSVGLAFALAAQNDFEPALLTGAVSLSIGIAVQNFPEGTAVALPLTKNGMSRRNAFWIASMTAFVEPVFGILAAAFSYFANSAISMALAFAAGTMLYVVVEELIPQAHTDNENKSGTIGFLIGFLIMMILDVSLG